MNASEQAKSLEMVSKIAATVNLVRSEFPDLTVDFSPWLDSSETRKFDDPHSIDLGFHFVGRSFTCQSRSILMQIRLSVPDATLETAQTVRVELSGHDYTGQQWCFTTNASDFWGIVLPLPKAQMQFKQICQQVVCLFDPVAKHR